MFIVVGFGAHFIEGSPLFLERFALVLLLANLRHGISVFIIERLDVHGMKSITTVSLSLIIEGLDVHGMKGITTVSLRLRSSPARAILRELRNSGVINVGFSARSIKGSPLCLSVYARTFNNITTVSQPPLVALHAVARSRFPTSSRSDQSRPTIKFSRHWTLMRGKEFLVMMHLLLLASHRRIWMGNATPLHGMKRV